MLKGKGEQQAAPQSAHLWYGNLEKVTTNGDYEATFHLEQPQPSFLALLASGYSPVYPCHVPAAQMRTKPIGTGPFKFVEFKQNEASSCEATPTTGRRASPISTASSSPSCPTARRRCWASSAGRFDMTLPLDVTIPLLKDVKSQTPNADVRGHAR